MNSYLPTTFPHHLHCLGICGRLVGGLAFALRQLGAEITGSDDRQFPPLPDLLRLAGIHPHETYSADHLPVRLDAVIIGGLITADNPELLAAQQRGVPIWNATAFLEAHFLTESQNYVVVGTKGKTTTTAMLTWIFQKCGLAPRHLIGGLVRQPGWPLLQLKGSPIMVLEGDEYPCSANDPLPKFLRYHPQHLIVTNVSHDHPDIYPTPASYAEVFAQACAMLPDHGTLILNADDPGALALAPLRPALAERIGFSDHARWRLTGLRQNGTATRFNLRGEPFRLRVPGRMNALNAALAATAAEMQGVSLEAAAEALADFPGVSGRQEILARWGRSVIYSDEAYHPVAVRLLLESIHRRHPKRRLIVLIGPCHTGGRNGVCQRELPEALSTAVVVLTIPAYDPVIAPDGPFDDQKLCDDLLQRNVIARSASTLAELIAHTLELFQPGDIVLISLPPGPPTAKERIVQALLAQV